MLFSLSTFSTIAHSRWEQKWQEGMWGFLSPKSEVSFPATSAAAGVMHRYSFCSNPIKYLPYNLNHRLSLQHCQCKNIHLWVPKWPNITVITTTTSTEYLPVSFVQIAIYFLQISKSWVKSQFFALDVYMFEDLTLIRLRSGDGAEEACGWRMSEVNVHGASQSFLGLTHRLAEIRQNGRLQV